MKTLVIYDSVYGNTEKIAQAIGYAIDGEVKVVRPGEVNLSAWKMPDLLIIGSPTLGGRPTQAIQDLLAAIPESVLKGINVATFDTRLKAKLVGVFGYAAARIANSLVTRGCVLIVSPEGFFVKGRGGPLKEEEPERADRWAKATVAACFNRVPM
jgi:flavodoxin